MDIHTTKRGYAALNESPSEKEGKLGLYLLTTRVIIPLNESPSEKEGKCWSHARWRARHHPSMKVPPKRKGNRVQTLEDDAHLSTLNESPSEKEGKFHP